MAKAMTEPPNPAYRDFDPKFSSEHVYFYYLKHVPHDYVEAYYIPLGVAVVPATLELMIPGLLASVKGNDPPKPVGDRLGSFVWRHRSYLVAVLEDPAQRLVEEDAVTFSIGGNQARNKTFRGGRDVPPLAAGITAFFCSNRMKNEHGNDLGQSGKETERIKIVVNHNLTGIRGGDGARAHTDTGTNTGPPQE